MNGISLQFAEFKGDAAELARRIDAMLAAAAAPARDEAPLAVVSPHAGYVYSGPIAAYAYRAVQGRTYDTVVVIGPSHRDAFTGLSVYDTTRFDTPLGQIPCDRELIGRLIGAHPNIGYRPSAHRDEHSLEVQVPFLQRALAELQARDGGRRRARPRGRADARQRPRRVREAQARAGGRQLRPLALPRLRGGEQARRGGAEVDRGARHRRADQGHRRRALRGLRHPAGADHDGVREADGRAPGRAAQAGELRRHRGAEGPGRRLRGAGVLARRGRAGEEGRREEGRRRRREDRAGRPARRRGARGAARHRAAGHRGDRARRPRAGGEEREPGAADAAGGVRHDHDRGRAARVHRHVPRGHAALPHRRADGGGRGAARTRASRR